MNILANLSKATAAFALLVIVAFTGSNAVAATPGQIEGGNIYQIQNVTKGAGFTNQATAAACDKLLYRARVYNPGPSDLTNVMVEVNMTTSKVTTHTSTITLSSESGNPKSTAALATVTVSTPQTVLYDSDASRGGVQLLDQNLSVVRSLSADIFDGSKHASIGTLAASQVEYVQFPFIVNCPTPPPATPAYTCDAFNVVADDNRSVTVSKFTTAATNGATFKNAVIDWGDKSAILTTTNAVGQTHQYTADGSYLISATAHFMIAGQTGEVTADGPQCQQQVVFKSSMPPVVTPPTSTPPTVVTTSTPPAATTPTPASTTPTTLVNTGTGSIAGLFTAATLIGAFVHRRLIARHLSSDS